jgi:hypothetical protein
MHFALVELLGRVHSTFENEKIKTNKNKTTTTTTSL